MKKKYDTEIFIRNGLTILVTRITNDRYGNPRFRIIAHDVQDRVVEGVEVSYNIDMDLPSIIKRIKGVI